VYWNAEDLFIMGFAKPPRQLQPYRPHICTY
jgi:hypothetical protein